MKSSHQINSYRKSKTLICAYEKCKKKFEYYGNRPDKKYCSQICAQNQNRLQNKTKQDVNQQIKKIKNAANPTTMEQRLTSTHYALIQKFRKRMEVRK